MDLLTQCIRCKKCQDSSNNIYTNNPNIIYSSGLCFECFGYIVRKKQIEKNGEYCFGSGKPCPNPQCSYKAKCVVIKEN